MEGDADLARKLQEELNRQQYSASNSHVRKTPEFIKTLSAYDYSGNLDVEMASDRNGEAFGEDMEQRDAEMARRIHERDLAYAQRNQGIDVEHQGISVAAATTEQDDTELARRMHESDLAYAQRNLGIDVDPDSFGASREQSDAEFARMIHERGDMAYSQRKRESDVDPEGFGVAATSTEQSDAELARMIHERDLAYSERHQGTSDYHHEGAEAYSDPPERLHEARQNGARFQESQPGPIRSGSDALIAKEIHEADIARVEMINLDKELALKLQAEEQVIPKGGVSYGYTPPSYFPGGAADHGEPSWKGWDGERPKHGYVKEDSVFSTAEHQKRWQEEVPGPWGMRQPVDVTDDDQPRPKTPPQAKAENKGKVPCQFCKQFFLFEGIHEHEVLYCQQLADTILNVQCVVGVARLSVSERVL